MACFILPLLLQKKDNKVEMFRNIGIKLRNGTNEEKFNFSFHKLVKFRAGSIELDIEKDRSLLFLIVPTFDTKVTEYLCSGWWNLI